LTPEPIRENTYNDSIVEKNKRYYYAITALDESGNESPKSKSVSEVIKD
jgi:fibronectin type 3 domain-containing protein